MTTKVSKLELGSFSTTHAAIILSFYIITFCNIALCDPKPYKQDFDNSWLFQEQLSDEFNGQHLNKEKWNTDIDSWGTWSWDAKNVSVSDGKLKISMVYERHTGHRRNLYYKSGIVKSRAKPILYGYFEARIKAADRYPGVSPAFWASNQTTPLWTEIDFVELTQRGNVSRIDTNIHAHRHPELITGHPLRERRSWYAPWDPRHDYHIYACEWNSDEIKWFIDGRLIGQARNRLWHQPLYVLLSVGLRYPLNSKPTPNGFPTTALFDYVRVWQKNTTQ